MIVWWCVYVELNLCKEIWNLNSLNKKYSHKIHKVILLYKNNQAIYNTVVKMPIKNAH